MKRLTFRPEFVEPICKGEKTGTSRWSDKKLKVGDVVAAVTKSGKRPAFLVPASERFATLEIVRASKVCYCEIGIQQARACGFDSVADAKAWYAQERPEVQSHDVLHFYEFKQAPHQAKKVGQQ